MSLRTLRTRSIRILIAMGALIAFVGCVGRQEPQVPMSPLSVTAAPTSSPSPPLTAEGSGILVQPITTAARLFLHAWSPDGRVLALWTFTPEEAAVDYTSPPGALHFLKSPTSQVCPSPYPVGYDYSGEVKALAWLMDGRVLLRTDDRIVVGTPCGADFTPVPGERGLPMAPGVDPSRSPGERYQARTVIVDATGHLAETSIVETSTGEVKQTVRWSYLETEGELGLGGEWLTEDRFLIRQTLDRGPLLVSVREGIVPVAPALFKRPAAVRCSEEPCGTYLAATGATVAGTSRYHLVLYGVGAEADFPNLLLYHSESGKVEELDAQHQAGFSSDGRWLILYMAEAKTGRVLYALSLRAVDPPGSAVHPLTITDDNPLPLAWSPQGDKVAVRSSEGITLFALPDGDQLAVWKTGDYAPVSALWSPDGKSLAVRGALLNGRDEALFVLHVPESPRDQGSK